MSKFVANKYPYRVENFPETTVFGISKTLNFQQYQVQELWKTFMPKAIVFQKQRYRPLFSISCYPENFFESFYPSINFQKWAAITIAQAEQIPQEWQTLTIPAGKYLVISFKGSQQEFIEMHQQLYATWLKENKFTLDHRPHFELLAEKYQLHSQESEEELWIPIQ